MTLVAHIALVDDWEAARKLGEYEVSTRGTSLDEAGFVHATSPGGVRAVLETRYSDIRDNLLVVILNTETLTAEGLDVTEEHPGHTRVFGPIQTEGDAVEAVLPIRRVNGSFVVPDLSRFSISEEPGIN